jgi:hypothetical protein
MANEKFSEFIVKTDLTDFTGLVGFETNTANYYITTSNFYNDLEANLDLTDFTTITGGAIGDVLTVDGTGAALEWSTPTSGTVTSVAASGGTTGMTWSGSPITNSGTLTLGGTLSAGHGGTGFTGPSNIGDIIAANTASTWTSIAAGALDHVLTSSGPGILPIWKVAPGGGTDSFQTTAVFRNLFNTGSPITGTTDIAQFGYVSAENEPSLYVCTRDCELVSIGFKWLNNTALTGVTGIDAWEIFAYPLLAASNNPDDAASYGAGTTTGLLLDSSDNGTWPGKINTLSSPIAMTAGEVWAFAGVETGTIGAQTSEAIIWLNFEAT